MRLKVISDSSSNVFEIKNKNYTTVPLKLLLDDVEYVDNSELDIDDFIEKMKKCKKSTTACPNSHEWMESFGDEENVFGITITSALSGSYNAAMQAKEQYMEENPGKNVHIVDSRSAGAHLHLLADRLLDKQDEYQSFEEAVKDIDHYQEHVHLVFALQCLDNLAKNGRVNIAVAKIAHLLGINIVGYATKEGELSPGHKVRGQKNAIAKSYAEMVSLGYAGGKVIISQCENEAGANALRELIISKHPEASVTIEKCTALCTYYAEIGGLMIGFEDGTL